MEPEADKDQVQQDTTASDTQSDITSAETTPQDTQIPVSTPENSSPANSESITTSGKKPFPKKLLLLLLLLVVAVAGAVGVYFYLQSNKTSAPVVEVPQITPTPFAFKAKVQYLTGTAYKVVDDRKTEILENDILDEGDVIETGEDTRLVISLDEGSVLRVDEMSRITLSKMTSPLSSVDQESGNVFYRVNKDEEHKFEVLTGEVKIESLGTAYSVENQEDVKVKVFESKVKVLSSDTETEVGKDQEWDEGSQEITGIDEKKLAASEFYQWSLTEEKLISPTVTPTPKPVATTKPQVSESHKIKAYAKKVTGGIEITWESSVDSPQGYKVVKNLTGSPVYPGDEFKYLSDTNARSVKWELQDGKTWHFRVCQYLGGSCGEYSNEVTITADGTSSDTTTSSVTSINLSASKKNYSTASLSWSVEGTASIGYKVCWSQSSNPTYPARSGDWAVPTTATSYDIGSLESGKTYYFRVCELLSGACGTYSNQATLTF